MSKTLFAIEVSGMDIVIPVRSMEEAVRAAAFMNADYLCAHAAIKKTTPDEELIPRCFARPCVWPYSPEAFEKELAKCLAEAKKYPCPHWLCAG